MDHAMGGPERRLRRSRRRYDEPVNEPVASPARSSSPARSRPWFDTPNIRKVLVFAGIMGFAMGVQTIALHLIFDPLADVSAYYDAGARLNAGQPLYEQAAGTNDPSFYRYPPLLAIAFRPLALLPYSTAAMIWETIVIVAFGLTILRLGPRRPATWVVLGMLALPIGWSLAVGQAQVLVTLLMALGAPWSLALATNLKLFPALAAVWWVGRREWGQLARFAAWAVGFGLLQLVLEPRATLAYPGFLATDQVGQVVNVSPYVVSPILWAVLVVAGMLAAIRWAPSRWGWALAVGISVLANPRLLVYQLSTLAAGLREPDAAVDSAAIPVDAEVSR